MHIGIDDRHSSPPEGKCHEEESCVVCDESECVVILEEVEYREEIAPVMCLFAHATDEWKRASTSIWDIECDVGEVLPEPPESYTRSVWIRLSHEEHIGDDDWDDELHEAATEYRHELTERHEYDMSCFVEYEIRPVYERIHDSIIDSECEELERVEEESYPEYES